MPVKGRRLSRALSTCSVCHGTTKPTLAHNGKRIIIDGVLDNHRGLYFPCTLSQSRINVLPPVLDSGPGRTYRIFACRRAAGRFISQGGANSVVKCLQYALFRHTKRLTHIWLHDLTWWKGEHYRQHIQGHYQKSDVLWQDMPKYFVHALGNVGSCMTH